MKTVLLNFLKGILAGLAIGLGGFLYVLMTFVFKAPEVTEIGKLLGSVLFAVGLFLVCTFGLSLYTGKIGLVFEKKQDKLFYISLPVMLVGNAIGAFALGYICYFIFRNTDFIESANAAANARLNFASPVDYIVTAVKSFLCGTCVYLAVKAFNLNRLRPVGILLLVFFVFVFVYCGFQHCIANMFYFGFANSLCWQMPVNLAMVILFNSFGPIAGVGLVKLIEKAK